MNEKELIALTERALQLLQRGGTIEQADALFEEAGAPVTFSEIEGVVLRESFPETGFASVGGSAIRPRGLLDVQDAPEEDGDVPEEARDRTRQLTFFVTAQRAIAKGASRKRVDEVLSDNGLPSFYQLQARFSGEEPTGPTEALLQKGEDFTRGALQGVTLGLVDEIGGLLRGAGAVVPGGQSPGEAFRLHRDRLRGGLDRARDRSGIATGVGELAGVVAIPTGAVLRILPRATKAAIRANAARVAKSTPAKVGGGAVGGGLLHEFIFD